MNHQKVPQFPENLNTRPNDTHTHPTPLPPWEKAQTNRGRIPPTHGFAGCPWAPGQEGLLCRLHGVVPGRPSGVGLPIFQPSPRWYRDKRKDFGMAKVASRGRKARKILWRSHLLLQFQRCAKKVTSLGPCRGTKSFSRRLDPELWRYTGSRITKPPAGRTSE